MSELKDGKHIKLKEYILYVLAVFFYTNMTGMINEYRRAYLVDILQLTTHQMSFFNVFTGVAGFALSFINAMILDSKKIKKRQQVQGTRHSVGYPLRNNHGSHFLDPRIH